MAMAFMPARSSALAVAISPRNSAAEDAISARNSATGDRSSVLVAVISRRNDASMRVSSDFTRARVGFRNGGLSTTAHDLQQDCHLPVVEAADSSLAGGREGVERGVHPYRLPHGRPRDGNLRFNDAQHIPASQSAPRGKSRLAIRLTNPRGRQQARRPNIAPGPPSNPPPGPHQPRLSCYPIQHLTLVEEKT